ncbi:MAG: amidohydrolase [Halobacteriales archaeon]
MDPDLIVHARTVRTMDETVPMAEAFAVTNSRFTDIGTAAEIDDLAGSDTEILRFENETILPGFIDPHCHMSLRGRRDLLQVDLTPSVVSSIEELIQELRAEAESTPAGEWILGYGYDDTKLAENRHPTRWDLDEASTDHPIYIDHAGYHIAAVNSEALARAGLDADTPEPEGGHFEREDGKLTGVLHEDARNPYRSGRDPNDEGLIPEPTPDEDQAALRDVCGSYNAVGITSIGDAVVTPSEIRMYRQGVKRDNLTVRAYLMIWNAYFDQLNAPNLDTGFGDELVRIGPIKEVVDGAIASRTAYLEEPYEGRPEDHGDLRLSQAELDETVMDAHEAGYQLAIHANGDAAIEMTLDAFENALDAHPREDHRHRIEHGTVVNDELLDRIQALGLSVFPFSTYIYQHGEKMADYGDRIERMFPYGSCVERDIPVAGSSDNPAGLLDPLLGIRTMVTRKTKDGEVLGERERVSVEDALRIYTINGAYASFEEDEKGSITLGKLGDFIVLSDDPMAVDPDAIHEIDVRRTYLGGEQVYPTD